MFPTIRCPNEVPADPGGPVVATSSGALSGALLRAASDTGTARRLLRAAEPELFGAGAPGGASMHECVYNQFGRMQRLMQRLML